MTKKQKKTEIIPDLHYAAILGEISKVIDAARRSAARSVNFIITAAYWLIGREIVLELQGGDERAEYGKQIVSALSTQLEREFGRGFGEKNLRRMIQFAEAFPDREIVVSLLRQLGWTHFLRLIPIDDPLKRDFYAEMCRIERWNTRTLGKKIGSMLFERTALSRKPAKLAEVELKQLREEDKVTPDVIFRDPYLLDFLGLKDVDGPSLDEWAGLDARVGVLAADDPLSGGLLHLDDPVAALPDGARVKKHRAAGGRLADFLPPSLWEQNGRQEDCWRFSEHRTPRDQSR